MKSLSFKTVFLVCISVLSIPSFSQINSKLPFSSAEKIYLQLDNKVYTTDQTIWFKAIITNAANHSLSEQSGILYTELIDPHENIIERKLIKISQGLGQGFFQLAPIYPYGTYQVRAYTVWNKNFGDNFFFKEYILVTGKQKDSEFNLIKSLSVLEDEVKGKQLKVELSEDVKDSLSGNTVRFIIEANEIRDTFSVRKSKSNQYLIDKKIPAKTEILSLHIETENHTGYSRTIVLDTNYLDVQFFPESGELVQGLPGTVGFKAIDYTGKGKIITGTITNSAGQPIASFASNTLGMGVFRLDTIDKDAGYKIKIYVSDGVELKKEFQFPQIAEKGILLSVLKKQKDIAVKAFANYSLNDSVLIRASCRGEDYFDFKGKFKNGVFSYSFSNSSLPDGIISFTLLAGKSNMPIAQRLYFNEVKAERLTIQASIDKDNYTQREQSQIGISILDGTGNPVSASVSLLVSDNSIEGNPAANLQTIMSYLLMSSDLNGIIESPAFYFENDSIKFEDIDALLLTQGWSKYNYKKEAVPFYFEPERNLVVTGSVKGGLSDKKIIKGAKMSMITFGTPVQAGEQRTDSLGRFHFVLKDDYNQNLPLLIQSSNKSNKNVSWEVVLDKKTTPPVVFNHFKKIDKPDSIQQVYIQKALSNQKTLDSIRIAAEGVMLQEVIVKSRVLSPEQKEVTEKYGEAKVVISGDRIREKEAKWSYGLYSVLMFNFPDQVMVRNMGNGFLYATLTSNMEVTLVVIDGIPVLARDYNSISSIPPSEVKSFELIPYANNFHALYCEAVYCGLGTPSVGNVIAIYTYAGKGLFGTSPTIGMNKMEIPVFAPTRNFYAPRYEVVKPEDWQKPDLRTLIHWQPDIVTDSAGMATTSFYNADITGKMKIIVEAISADGRIGYKELWYDVRRRKE